MKIDLYFWALLDRFCHVTRLAVKTYFGYKVCGKLCDACEKYDDWRFF